MFPAERECLSASPVLFKDKRVFMTGGAQAFWAGAYHLKIQI